MQTRSRFEKPEEFGQVVVRSNPDGSQVLLKDVSRIELGAQNYLYKVRLDGRPTAMLQVFQLPDANGLEVAEQILAAMERISQRFPDDLEYVVSLDTTVALPETPVSTFSDVTDSPVMAARIWRARLVCARTCT